MKSRRVRVSHLLLALSAVPLVAGGARLVQLAALRAIVERRYRAHGAWMLRTYALGLGAGTQVLLFLPVELLLAGPVHGRPRDILMAAAWGLDLVASELFIVRMSSSDSGMRPPPGTQTSLSPCTYL